MGTFILILLIIGVIFSFISGFTSRSSPYKSVDKITSKNPTRYSRDKINYDSIPHEIKTLIENDKSFELAEILVSIEIDGHQQNLKSLLRAIKYKSLILSKKVEKIRQDLRHRNNLD